MSHHNVSESSNDMRAVPLEVPPAYEPKPHDDGDDVQSPPRKLIWKKLLLSFALVILSLWFTSIVLHAFNARRTGTVYSSSYSKEHRFRPAASPVITETLVDGRTRIRGAQPTAR